MTVFVIVLVGMAVMAVVIAGFLMMREVTKEPPLEGTWSASASRDGQEVALWLTVNADGTYTQTEAWGGGSGHIDAARGEWYQTPADGRGFGCSYELKGDTKLVIDRSPMAGSWTRVGVAPAGVAGDAVETGLVGDWQRTITRANQPCQERVSIGADGSYTQSYERQIDGVLTLEDGTWSSTAAGEPSGTYVFPADDRLELTDAEGTTSWQRAANPWDDAEAAVSPLP